MFTISVCMIVKNEEKVIERVLGCAKKFADEIIIVDTGSHDNTIELAQKYADKIEYFKWCNDFSKARNYSFSFATCDYVMWLDADDYITQSNIDKIKELKKRDMTTDVFMFKYLAGFDENGVSNFEFFRERLLKRANNYVWAGFVHEAIPPWGKIEKCNIEIEHRKLDRHDPKRNLLLYRYAMKNNVKFEPREQYYYSRELYYNGYYKKAIKEFSKYLKMNDTFTVNVAGAYLMLADCECLLKRPKRALKVMFECIKHLLPTAEMCCKLGQIYQMMNLTSQSIFWYKSAFVCEKQIEGFVNPDFERFYPALNLVVLYDSIGDVQKAYEFHNIAKKIKPKHSAVIYNEEYFKNIDILT